MDDFDAIEKLLKRDISYDKVEVTKLDKSSLVFPKASEKKRIDKDKINRANVPLQTMVCDISEGKDQTKQVDIQNSNNQRFEFIGSSLAEKSHLPHLYTVIDMKDKNTANKPQSDIIAGGLNYNSFVLSKIFDLRRNPMISKELQYAMIMLFDNLEKLSSNCDQYTARHSLRKEKGGRLHNPKLHITKTSDKIIIPKNMIK